LTDQSPNYEPLTTDSIPSRLCSVAAIADRLGNDPGTWSAREVGDGNLNLVFIVTGPKSSLIVKQALPYVRLVGDSWPLPLKRAFFEYHALTRQAARDPGMVPEIHYFDEDQALIVMEFLSPHVILRHWLMAGTRHESLAKTMGQYCARTLFRGSDLSMDTARRKADLALFADNVALCDITENLVFSDPYYEAKMNRHTTPHLDDIVARLRRDIDLKVEVQHLKAKFCNNAETMLHGDLHTGSIMVTPDETKVIDPEFVTYGPIGFDVGMLLANFLLAYYAQPGHAEKPGDRAGYQEWILGVVNEIWTEFTIEFSTLWRSERTGILYQKTLYEDQGDDLASEQALGQRLTAI
jgi:5-methylthioribose kinase